MQRILSILLLAIFGLPVISPLLALGAQDDGGLPACCRRNGKHHCGMSMGGHIRLAQHEAAFSALPDKCPYCPAGVVGTHTYGLTAHTVGAGLASLASHPAGIAQTESKRRIGRDRSRQKRGPPANLLS